MIPEIQHHQAYPWISFVSQKNMFQKLDWVEGEHWASISWANWTAQNRFLFEGLMTPPRQVVEIGNNMSDFNKANERLRVN